jgi:membrane associated rhomboid family serine protease
LFIPLGCDPPPRRAPVVVPFIIGLNVAVMLAGLVGERALGWPVERLADAGMLRSGDGFRWWQLASYQFLHDPWGITHLLFNMVFLWVFGNAVESRLGRFGFVAFYIAGGAAAGLAHIASSTAPVIGASGSTAATAGAFLALFPRARIRTLLVFLLIGVYLIPAGWFIGLYVALDLLGALGGRGSGVAYVAHLGGYAFGLVTGLGLLATGIVPRGEFDLLYLFRQWNRRRAMRRAVAAGPSPWASAPAPSTTARPSPSPDAEDPFRSRRAEVGRRLEQRDYSGAVDRFLSLLAEAPDTVLSPDHQEEIATQLAAAGHDAAAVAAWERLIEQYPLKGRTPEIRLLLAAKWLRSLGRPDRARPHLEAVRSDELGAALRSLHAQLSAELPPVPS